MQPNAILAVAVNMKIPYRTCRNSSATSFLSTGGGEATAGTEIGVVMPTNAGGASGGNCTPFPQSGQATIFPAKCSGAFPVQPHAKHLNEIRIAAI